jgi:diacylglycerol kinase family enzyme
MFSGIDEKVKNYKHVVIAGGDGSFEGALNYKPLEKKSLGFFPLGAGNAFYSYFYIGKRFEYLRSRFNFLEMKLDILELEWDKGKVQTSFLSLGVDAEVMRLSSKNRTQHGLFDYVAASWKALFKAKGDYDLSCTIDGKEKTLENCVNFTFAKIPYIGYGIRALPGVIEPNDGKIYGSACINSHSHFFNKPVRLWGLILGTLGLNRPPLFKFKGKKIKIRSEVPFPLQAGGEFLGYTHWVKIRVLRKQKVLVI